MSLQIAKWGNSLAVRLPAALAKEVGWHAGDVIDISAKGLGKLELVTSPPAPAPTSVRAMMGMLRDSHRTPLNPTDPDHAFYMTIKANDDRTHS